jgi:hypothetical protein
VALERPVAADAILRLRALRVRNPRTRSESHHDARRWWVSKAKPTKVADWDKCSSNHPLGAIAQLLSNAVRQSMCATIASMHSTIHERMRRIEGMEKCLLEEQCKMSARWLYVLATKSQHRSVLTITCGG